MPGKRQELHRPRFRVLIASSEPETRALICGYPVDRDCLGELTFLDLSRFADSGWLRHWGSDPALRDFTQASVTIYGTWGFRGQVQEFLQHRADRTGFRVRLRLPPVEEDAVHLFIVGACRHAE